MNFSPPRNSRFTLNRLPLGYLAARSPDLKHFLFQRLGLRGDQVPHATFVEPNILSEYLTINKAFDFDADTFRWVLIANANAPVVGSTNLLANITQIATGGGYTQMTDGAGGVPSGGIVGLSFSRSNAQSTFGLTSSVVLTASGAIATFQWLALVDDTPASPLNPVVGWLDHGAGVTMAATDTYTIPAGALFTVN
jgi:hypothetical protein